MYANTGQGIIYTNRFHVYMNFELFTLTLTTVDTPQRKLGFTGLIKSANILMVFVLMRRIYIYIISISAVSIVFIIF
jgi:hypothetical protein